MEPKPTWSFKKGNVEGLTVVQSGNPIEKKEIASAILDFLCEKFPVKVRSLRSNNFTIEFKFFVSKGVGSTGTIKIVLEPSKENLELKLVGADSDKFISLTSKVVSGSESEN